MDSNYQTQHTEGRTTQFLKLQIIRCLLILSLSTVSYAVLPIVTTKSGVIIGSEERVGGRYVQSYLGIPFAEKPIGDLRFRKTVPVQPWRKPIRANRLSAACLQNYPYAYPWVDEMPGKSEDCLYLNVWVPEGASWYSPKPVMMWIYGGAFSAGSSRLAKYQGNVLAAKGNVIVVTLNYRLGIFGFLSTSSTEAPGNMGLFDTLEGLKWIKKNIRYFGGDKENISLFGASAGAVTQAYFTVSPLTRGMFHKVMMESGTENPLVTAGGDPRDKNIRLGQEVAEVLGCASNTNTMENSPKEIVRCLRTKDADHVQAAVSKVVETVETFLPIYGDEFMPKKLFEAIKDNDSHVKDVFIGNVQDEASFILTSSESKVFGPYGYKDTLINKTFAKDIIVSNFMGYIRAPEVADYYLLDVPEGYSAIARKQAYYAIGDFFFFCPLVFFAEMMSARQRPVFYYYFDYRNDNTVFAPWMGVTHFSEVPFVFGRPFDTANYTKEERSFSRGVIEYWTNYARYGFPSASWKRFSTLDGDRPYVEIIRMDDDYPNYVKEHFDNCQYLRKFYDFLK